MLSIIEAVWFFCLLVISLYHLYIFRLRKNHLALKNGADPPGVSIIIAIRNGTAQLTQNLPEIIHQDYPSFEVIIVDDHSDPAQKKRMEEFISFWPKVKLVTSKAPGKKNALLTGIENSKYDFLLFTDADCRPASRDWIKTMMESGHGKGPVIGYSPYQKLPGFLNVLIRFETVMTGIQYLSWAMRGKPYMAVGRNILYPRALMIELKPFSHHQDLPYGDDDLGLQVLSDKSVINVAMDAKAHVISIPAATWPQWLKQKHRHLSAGHYYKPGKWLQPGVYGIALIGHWFLLPFMFDSLLWWKWMPIFMAGLLLRWLNYARWTRKLGDNDTAWPYPFLEIIYTIYLAFIGITTVVAKKKTWN